MIDTGAFLIDAYEVTNADYLAFVEDAVDPTSQPSVCAWNDSFGVSGEEGCTTNVFSPAKTAVTCVDWCDAAAFCAWAGKRLCGRVGGGTVPPSENDDPAKNQWFAACSNNGTRAFPYGNDWDPDACNTYGNGADVFGVGLFPDCNGGFDGIFDMVGNAEEWIDACSHSNDPALDSCSVRGGAFWSDNVTPDRNYATCAYQNGRGPPRSGASADWGFRCCKDTP